MISLKGDAHETGSFGRSCRQIEQVEIEKRIAVQKKEFPVQPRGRVLQRTGRAAWNGFGHHRDCGGTPALALIAIGYLPGLMAGEKQNVLNGGITRQIGENVMQEPFSCHLK